MQHFYLIALGGNRYHHEYGPPKSVLAAATDALTGLGTVENVAPVMTSRPMGHSKRQFANGALILRCNLGPRDLLQALKKIESEFGRRKGRRWGERTLDLDIILWSGGPWSDDRLTIPHPHFRERDFVLTPALSIAADWRDPVTSLSIRQLAWRQNSSARRV